MMLRKDLKIGVTYYDPLSTKNVLVWKIDVEDKESGDKNHIVYFRYYNDTTGQYEDHTALDNQLQTIPNKVK